MRICSPLGATKTVPKRWKYVTQKSGKEGKVVMDGPYTSTEMLTAKAMRKSYPAQMQLVR